MKSLNKTFFYIFIILATLSFTSFANAATLTVNTTSTIDADTISGYTDVTVDAAGADITITFDDSAGNLTGVNWLFDDSVGGGSIIFSGNLATDGTVTIDTTITHAQGDVVGVDIKTSGSITITANGSIDVSAKGCKGTTGSAGFYHDLDSNSCVVSPSGYQGGGAGTKGGGGGANGGNGGVAANSSGYAGTAYSSNDVLDVNDPNGTIATLGGGGGRMNNRAGGAGGGIIKLDSNSLTVNGALTATGGGGSYASGAGAGGTIFIKTITFNAADTSIITAKGQNGGWSGTDRAGAGGGGRLILFYQTDSQSTTGNISTSVNSAKGVNNSYASQSAYDGTADVIQYTKPAQVTITSPLTGSYNFGRNGTITIGSYSSNGLPQTSATVKIYTDALKSNLVATCTVDSGTSITINTTNCTFAGALSGQTQLAAYTTYYAEAFHTNAVDDATASTLINFKTLYTGSASSKSWQFDAATPSNSYTFSSTYVQVNTSNNSLAELKNNSGVYGPAKIIDGAAVLYKKAITLTNNDATSYTDLPIELTVTYDANMQADFDDIRFTESDESTVVPYWVESKTDSTTATVWIKTDLGSSATKTIYMYYGSSSATSTSSGSDVFTFFEDFESNSQTWDVDDANDSISTEQVKNGTYAFKNGVSNGGWTVWNLPSSIDRTANNWQLEGWFYQLSTGSSTRNHAISIINDFNTSKWYHLNWSMHNNYHQVVKKNGGNTITQTRPSPQYNQWLFGRLHFGNSNTSVVGTHYQEDETQVANTTRSDSTYQSFNAIGMVGTGTVYVDDLRLRKKAVNLPTINFGSETSSGVDYNDASILPKASTTYPEFEEIYSFTEVLGDTNAGTVKYQLHIDTTNNGTLDTICYHNGTAWTTASNTTTHMNTITELNRYAGTIDSECGTGALAIKSFLISNGSQKVELDSISVSYAQQSISASINDVTVNENAGTATFTVTLTEAPASSSTIDYATTNGTATAGSDYTSTSGTLTFTTNDSSLTFTVPITDDNLDEPSTETFTVNISNPSAGITIDDGSGIGTISDNDNQPTLAVADQTVAENAGTQTVNVTLTGYSQDNVSVNYSTTDLTASSGSHYTSASGTLTWSSGETGNKTISIPITDDLIDNTNRTFRVDLASASSASISDANGTITITDNEATSAISLNDPNSNEGNNVTFIVSMTPASANTVTVDYTTANGTATAGSDYTARSGSLTFNPGETSKTVAVNTTNDSTAEGSETILLNLSNVSNGTLADSQGEGTINDNDAPSIAISDITAAEGDGTVTVVVALTGISDSDTTVDYATAGSTATSGTDFTATSGTLTWTAGQTGNKSFTVTIAEDSLDEDSEIFVVNLNNASNGSISDSQASITITDNDTPPSVSIALNNNSIAEGESATVTATLSAVSGRDVTLNLTHSGTADNTDINKPSTLTVSAGNLTGTYTAAAVDDDLDENNETNIIDVSSVSGATDATSALTLTITDNDTAGVTVTQTSGSTAVTEGSTTDAFTVVLDSEPSDDVVFTLASANSEVTLSVDELTFTTENWDTPQTVTVTAVDDSFDEDSPHSDSVTFSVASVSDVLYDGMSVSAVSVAITDNDAAGIVVTKTGGSNSVTEGGTTDTFTVVLNTAPVDDVVIDLTTTPSGQITTSPTSLTFTDQNFDTPQTVTITATDNRVPEETALAAVNFAITTLDTDYDAINLSSENCTVIDNDSEWVNITEVDADETSSEAGNTKRYSVVLNSQPSSPVGVRFQVDSEVTVNVSLMSFHNQSAHANAWNKPKILTVTPVDDADIEGPHQFVISVQTTGPGDWEALPIDSITGNIIDNDAAEEEEEEGGSSTGGDSTGGSSTSGSTTSGSTTSGSTTSGSTTSGSSTSGSTTSGSTTSGSTTSGSTTSGSTTGNNRPERQIYITKLTAGNAQTVRPDTGVRLRGRITKNPDGRHNAQWVQTEGPTVELSNINALQPSFTSPSDFEGDSVTLKFKLIATTNADQQVATTSVVVRKKVDLCLGSTCDDDDDQDPVQPPKGPECKVIGMTNDGKAICEEPDIPDECPAGTLESMSVGGQKICNPFNKPPKILPVGDLVVIGFPFYNRGRGKVVIYPVSEGLVQAIDPSTTDEGSNIIVIEGSQSGDLFGHEIKMCDFNGDGQDDIYVTAPNTRKGTGYLIEITRDSNNTLEADTVGVITGGQHPLRTKFMQCLNYNGSNGDELFLPVKLEGSSSRNASNSLSFSVSGAQINDDGQMIFASESEVDDSNVAESTTAFNGLEDSTISSASQIDLSVTDFTSLDTDVEIDAMSSGDLNADGYDDLVLASTETCDVYVYFGQADMDAEISTYNEIACQEGSNFTDLVIGDVTGDGIDDLILVFPSDGGDGGSIYILPGVEDMSADDMSSGQTIYGTAENPITGLILADTDGDGDSEIIINNGKGGSNIIGGDGSILDTSSGGTTTTSGFSGGGVSTGCQLSTGHKSQAASLYWVVIILSLSTLIIARKKQKQE